MSYREPLPENCPPPEAKEIMTAREVYRLVRSNPPMLDDFRSQRAEKPGAVLRDMSPGTRRSDAHVLNVVIPAAAGPFRLVLEAASAPGVFGHNTIAKWRSHRPAGWRGPAAGYPRPAPPAYA
jgi:hypothetical protein